MKISIPYNYIAIEGNIGAGKTTLTKMLAKQINGKIILEQFEENPFLPLFYEDQERYAFPVELFFLTERHKQLREVLMKPDLFFQYYVADYIFFKTLLFAKNNLNEQEYVLFRRIFDALQSNIPKPDILLYLHRSPEILLNNISNRGRNYEQNIGKEYLVQVQKAYFDYFKAEQDVPILIINPGEQNFSPDSQNFLQLIEALEKSYDAGMHIIDL